MKNKKKAFTLVELLAVIVILAVILVIAIPQIMKVIKASRLSAIKDSTILIAEQADKDFMAQQILNKDYSETSIPCTDVAKLNDDYDSCTITYNNGIATVTLKGKAEGKFSGITCTGTKDNMCCTTEGEENTCTTEGSGLEVNIDNLPTIMAWAKDSNNDFHNGSIRTTITEIEFVDSNNIDVPNINNTSSWDVSEAKDESVIAWIDGTKLYIGGQGGVKANSDSSNIFRNFTNLTKINFNNNYKTNNVTNMSYMFTNSTKLETLDLSSFDTSKVTNMAGMFAGITGETNSWGTQTKMALSDIDLSSFNTSNVLNMDSMFLNCGNLVILDVSSFDTSKVENMKSTFDMPDDRTSKLETIVFGDKWDTSNVIDMFNMFVDNVNLTTLDLRYFDTSNVKNTGYMFEDNRKLTSIYVSDNFVSSKVEYSYYMFHNCPLLVGGNGTKHTSSYEDKVYARVDKNGQKGYFTDFRQNLSTNNIELEYLKFNGSQYIDTGIIPSNHKTEIKFDFESFGQDEHLFGTSLGNNYYYFTSYNNFYYWGLDGSYSGGPVDWSEGMHTLIYNEGNSNNVIFDGTIVGSNAEIMSTKNILIGRRGSATTLNGKIYYMKIIDNETNTLVRDYIPVHNTILDTYGLYDKVEGKFYRNNGTGNFTPGPEI